MKSIITLLFTLCLSLSAFTQKLDYDNNYKWYFGFNTGAAWQSSDISNKTKLGWGFTLGKSFLMDYGRPISFDVRGRYLRGYWEGIDTETTSGNTGNTTVDSIYGGGLIKRNFLSEQHRIALELVIHANNIRERTGWDPYVFLGLGITGHNAFGDYITYDDNGTFLEQTYDFSSNENTDGVYEFAMANSANSLYSKDRLEWNFMPSLGFGLGYFVSPYITVGLEHKSTFTLTDHYDGYAAGEENDIYHYTNGYIRFYLGSKKKDLTSNKPATPSTPDPVTENPRPINPNTPNPISDSKPPIVDYTQPSTSPYATQNNTYNLKAIVKRVESSENIIFRQNGTVKTDFVFNENTNSFSSTVNLIPGQNIFVIIASNAVGDDTETMIINYEREVQTPPVVTITRPTSNPENVNTINYNFNATVLNVAGKDNIELILNGNQISNFNYTANTSGVNHTLTLQPGTNTVRITGTNTAGSDTESTIILYRPGNTVELPEVNFTNPNTSPYTLNNNTFNLVASVLNINNRAQLTFKQNGSINSNFNFNNTSFSSNVVLIPGQNVFELIGTNTAGTDNTSTIVIYNRPAPKPPVVTISKPFNSPFTTSNNTTSINATLLNISNKNQITALLNGSPFTNFNFNTQSSTLTANVNLQEGSNSVNISATNTDGTDSEQTVIIYTPVLTVQPPLVDFTLPNTNPFNTTAEVQMVNANVYNVANKNQISVLLNGQNVSNFVFNASTHVVGLNTNLIQGANLITITATNTAGVASETQTIIRNNPAPQNPPVVTFINPINDPITVFTNNYTLVAKVQNVVSKQNINLKINGIATTNFSFSTSNSEMNFSTGLINGANTIEITGTNNYGQDIATTTIIYKRQNTTSPPSVNITNPNATSSVSNQQNISINAAILNVTNANQITMTLNGSAVNGFVFNSNTHILSYSANLNNGLNTIIISASNNAGTASDNAFITYRPQEVVEPPFVSFVKPTNSGSIVNTAGYMVEAKVLHVTNKNGINLKFNGQTINPAYYSFNVSTQTVKYASTLTLGNNIFEITGTNTAGTANASTLLNYTQAIEEPCNSPSGTIISPSSNGSITNNPALTLKANVQYIEQPMSEISLKINGNSLSFNFNNSLNQITKNLLLTEGNNTIEIILETACGKKRIARSIVYKKEEEPCDAPLINPVSPGLTFTTEMNNASLKAIFSHVENAEQIRLMVNGKKETFNYEKAQHTLTAFPELIMGTNKIVLLANTTCGTDEVIWNINRKPCNKPVINVVGKPTNNGIVTSNDFKIVGSIRNLNAREVITTSQNGKEINFVYNANSESYSTSTLLKEGLNTFIITANSACGKTIKTIKVTYKPIPDVAAPTVTITNPSSSTFSTEATNYFIKAKTTHITAANQIAVSVNGGNVNFNFNPSTALISFNQPLSVGQNKVVITVVNAGGTATDNTTLFHTEPAQIDAPVINISTPNSNPHITNRNGRVLVTGTISNISADNQVQILFNGNSYTGNAASIENEIYTFNFYVPVTDAIPSTTVTILASNAGGTDSENQIIQKQTTNTGVTSGGGTITIGGGGLGGGN